MYNVDGNGNVVLVSAPLTRFSYEGKAVCVVRLADRVTSGYIVVMEGEDSGFGSDECPSSYGCHTIAWFGEGTPHESVYNALTNTCGAPWR
jgi:hypothetical protein